VIRYDESCRDHVAGNSAASIPCYCTDHSQLSHGVSVTELDCFLPMFVTVLPVSVSSPSVIVSERDAGHKIPNSTNKMHTSILKQLQTQ